MDIVMVPFENKLILIKDNQKIQITAFLTVKNICAILLEFVNLKTECN
jgi:hypothetical protein